MTPCPARSGADLNLRDKGGHTAYKIAKTKIGGEIEELLLAANEGRPLPEPEAPAPAQDEKEL